MSASTLYEHAATTSLEHLGLRVASDRLDQACQLAAAEAWSYSHFLGATLDSHILKERWTSGASRVPAPPPPLSPTAKKQNRRCPVWTEAVRRAGEGT
jgi:hypothetical protein